MLPTRRALLLVDDETSPAFLALKEGLSALGFLCQWTHSASGASCLLRQAESHGEAFDLLVLREAHGGICGLNLAAALCLNLAHRPRIALSGPARRATAPSSLAQRCVDLELHDGDDCQQWAQALAACFHPLPMAQEFPQQA